MAKRRTRKTHRAPEFLSVGSADWAIDLSSDVLIQKEE
jgi:hypothetical protein